MFWDIYLYECNKNGEKPHGVLKKLNISTGAPAHWKKGTAPSGDILNKIAEYFNVSIEYLMGEADVSVIVNEKKSLFKKMFSLPQRWISLRSGSGITDKKIIEITEYVNCDNRFIYNEQVVEYTPVKPINEYNKYNLNNQDILFDVLDYMDRCADDDKFKAIQIQLSRIVLYWIKKKSINEEHLKNIKELSHNKIKFLLTNIPNKDVTLNYGLNYTDLAVLREKTGCSYQYMFTGVEKSPINELKEKIAILEDRIAELEAQLNR